jgi:hypothetical protein
MTNLKAIQTSMEKNDSSRSVFLFSRILLSLSTIKFYCLHEEYEMFLKTGLYIKQNYSINTGKVLQTDGPLGCSVTTDFFRIIVAFQLK